MSQRWIRFTWVAAAVVAADQLTKVWARASLPVDAHGIGIPVPVIEHFFDWRIAYNTGSAFSLLAGQGAARVLLSIVAIAAVVFIVWTLRRLPAARGWVVAAFGLVAGGAVGNLIDRVAFGKVTDFILWHYHEHGWPVFNVADAALCVGVGLLLVTNFGRDASSEAKDAEAASRAPSPRR